ncbi:lytic transglycosylase domain-containing protein [Oceanomicrobium pacificus]|uniref:Transglycosylase SLT domain-containing protein n=1 Tax=Oceanomicrobium pacificus TaxID=2692916 RepID=A0A6B0U2Y4_9RHOB|nr:lytic transglycosylase domain-containing protein [Oceanomicrobium pacificus]MXU65341.1 transglycosylase SLT domain-containing protein [Oceanomicrobium pacificus]
MAITGIRSGLVFGLALSVVLASGAGAESSFTFKRIKPPGGATGKRINIQVDPTPAEQPAIDPRVMLPMPQPDANIPVPDRAPPPTAVAKPGSAFWEAFSPAIAAADDRRLAEAADFVGASDGAQNFDAARRRMERLAVKFGPEIIKSTIGTKVSPALVLAVIGVESAGRPEAKSHAGAVGLMQLMPATAKRFGVSDRTDPAQNIRGGTAYLDWLLAEFGRDPLLALAGYNAGEGAVKAYEGIPPYAETRDYVPKVVAAWRVARTLCMTPPIYADDGCVFMRQAALSE